MITVSILISASVISTLLINYKLYNECIIKKKYDDIPELNEIKKKISKDNINNNKKFKKIMTDYKSMDKDTIFNEFILIEK
tara:strand:- start:3323 stop:3565 length:243 start_codon:yes stop_codon:yes gene_type:complete